MGQRLSEQQKRYSLPSKKNGKLIFLLTTRQRKKFRSPNIWKKTYREPALVFMQNSDDTDHQVPRKGIFQEMKRKGM